MCLELPQSKSGRLLHPPHEPVAVELLSGEDVLRRCTGWSLVAAVQGGPTDLNSGNCSIVYAVSHSAGTLTRLRSNVSKGNQMHSCEI